MTAIRIIDDHTELANIGSNTHAQIDTRLTELIPYTGATSDVDLGTHDLATAGVLSSRGLKILGNYTLAWRNPADTVTNAYLHYDGNLQMRNVSGNITLQADLIDLGTTPLTTTGTITGVISHADLTNINANDHHNELHSIASHSDTSATGAQLDTLTDNSIADTLHRHSELVASDGSPDPALSVDAAGSVGIGTTEPQYKLHVHNGGGLFSRNVNDHYMVGFRYYKDRAGATVNNFDNLGNLRWYGYDGSNYIPAAEIKVLVDGVPGTNDMPGALAFCTTPSGSSASLRRMYLKNNGHIGIGTSAPATSALLDLASTTGALLLTRMTTAQKNALTAVNGMLLYDSTLNKFQGYENGSWTSLI